MPRGFESFTCDSKAGHTLAVTRKTCPGREAQPQHTHTHTASERETDERQREAMLLLLTGYNLRSLCVCVFICALAWLWSLYCFKWEVRTEPWQRACQGLPPRRSAKQTIIPLTQGDLLTSPHFSRKKKKKSVQSLEQKLRR